MITICVWPDDTWCYLEDLEEYLTWHSDDYLYLTMTEEIFEENYGGVS